MLIKILKFKDSLNKILSENTGKPLEQIKNDVERDYFMEAQEAADYGLVDQVITRSQISR